MTTYSSGFAITPSDSNTFRFSAIYVGGAGHVVIVTDSGSEMTLNSVPVGTILPIRGIRVKSTGTTATNLVGLMI